MSWNLIDQYKESLNKGSSPQQFAKDISRPIIYKVQEVRGARTDVDELRRSHRTFVGLYYTPISTVCYTCFSRSDLRLF